MEDFGKGRKSILLKQALELKVTYHDAMRIQRFCFFQSKLALHSVVDSLNSRLYDELFLDML